MTGGDNQMFHLKPELGPETRGCWPFSIIVQFLAPALPSNIIRIKQWVLLLASSKDPGVWLAACVAILPSDWLKLFTPMANFLQTFLTYQRLWSIFAEQGIQTQPFQKYLCQTFMSLSSILTRKHPSHLSKLCCLVSTHNQIIKNKNLADIISHTTSFIVHAIYFNYENIL